MEKNKVTKKQHFFKYKKLIGIECFQVCLFVHIILVEINKYKLFYCKNGTQMEIKNWTFRDHSLLKLGVLHIKIKIIDFQRKIS